MWIIRLGVKIHFNTYLGFIKRTFLTREVRMDKRFVSFIFGFYLATNVSFLN